ncbi:MAG: TonB-dependent receptor [Gammaproteobacteria bacterium]|nr:TonB-dependent receptor [Gammaproteobacteria bacterium]
MTLTREMSSLLLRLVMVLVLIAQARASYGATEEQFYFHIPRLSADKALVRFAQQAEITLLYPYSEIKKYKTQPLFGRYTIRDGLQLMLSGTDIRISAGVGSPEESYDSDNYDSDLETENTEESDMNKISKTLTPSVISLAVAASLSSPLAQAQNTEQTAGTQLEEVVVLGSRSAKPRSAADSPVPVDVISEEDFSALGNGADITDNLKTLVPSYTATPATGDGSAFVRPTSLRGMSPDQTLILVNGKRRHRSALVQFFAPAAGNGSHGVDVGMIPSIALKNVQVLRDGAAAQYGSDAIAGVMNFELKDANDGGEIQVSYGEFYEGESSTKIAANLGFAAGENGFINASIEYSDNEALSRGLIRPDAQALVDAGFPGVGADSPFGDAPFTQTWGRPETDGTRIFLNAGWELANGAEIYAFGNYADTDGRYRFFYRNPSHPSIAALGLQDQLPVGYTPFLDGAQTDTSFVAGYRGEFASGTTYDFSVGYGKNELDYFLNNTLNPSLPLLSDGTAVRDFDVGAYEQDELNFNADFSTALTDSLSLSYGAEYREETFTQITGDANAITGSGPSGFRPPSPESAGSFDRDNFAVYADLEHDISDRWLMQYALRYEDFSDFGSTTNWKVATRYNVTDTFTIRGAASTGFHAPTPGQANISSIITTFDGRTGLQVEEGLVPANSPQATAAGGTNLKEEESTNLSFGFTTPLGSAWDLTVDFYSVDVEDRIYRTGDIPIPGSDGRTLSFYTNALELEHSGFDVVLNGSINWGDIDTSVTFAYAHNEIDVTGQTPVQGINPVSDSTIEDIENNYPEDRFTLSTNTFFNENWNLVARATYYGSHFDERGTINGPLGNRSSEIDSIVYFDLELGWQVNDALRVVFGGSNVFDSYVDEIENDGVFANRQSVGLQYPRRTAANYEGGSWYLKGIYNF